MKVLTSCDLDIFICTYIACWQVQICNIMFPNLTWYSQLHLTFWCLKKVLNETHARPICLKIRKTLLADHPATRIAKQSNRFPGGVLLPTISGWLLQTFSFARQLRLEHVVLTSTILPIWRVPTIGLGVLQIGHSWNSSNSCDRKTIYFGSERKLRSLVLKWRIKIRSYPTDTHIQEHGLCLY